MHKHFTSRHAINLHKCDVFDMLPSDGGDPHSFQSGASEIPMRISEQIEKESH